MTSSGDDVIRALAELAVGMTHVEKRLDSLERKIDQQHEDRRKLDTLTLTVADLKNKQDRMEKVGDQIKVRLAIAIIMIVVGAIFWIVKQGGELV